MPGTKGRSGRKPKPTHLKVLEGNRGKRKLDADDEIQPEQGEPDCPDWLDAEAKEEWARVCPELHRLGVLALIDRASLAAYCAEWARFVAAEADIAENGMVLVQIEKELDDGRVLVARAIKNPSVQISKEAQAAMRAWAGEFGLSPSARTRVKTPGKAGDDGGSAQDPRRLLS